MPQKTLLNMIDSRSSSIAGWLGEKFPSIQSQQRHLDETAIERGYWHLGYQAALADILALSAAQLDAAEPAVAKTRVAT